MGAEQKGAIKVSPHAERRLRERCPGLQVGLRELLGQGAARRIYQTPSGDVYPLPATSALGFIVIRDSLIVTVITHEMAFSDCPQAVFSYLLRQGDLAYAMRLRASYIAGDLPKGIDGLGVTYPRSCATLWGAFRRVPSTT